MENIGRIHVTASDTYFPGELHFELSLERDTEGT